MSKKFIFLCLLLLVVLGIYIWLVNSPLPSIPKAQLPNAQTEDTKPFVQLSFTPSSITASAGANQRVAVSIQTKNTIPNVIELELSYDPSVLGNVSVGQGTYFQNPSIVLNTVDPSSGRISYALEQQSSNNSTGGIVAYIYFTPLTTYSSEQTQITFLPRTLVHAKSEKNQLTNSQNLQISIISLIPPVQKVVLPTSSIAPHVLAPKK